MQRRCFSWNHIHETCLQSVHQLQEEFAPTLLVAISGGGLIPARLLRSGFKSKTGKTLPIQVIGAVRYDDDNGKVHDTVTRTQWLSPDLQLSGQRILLVDEVDDSRKTLAFIVDEMVRYLDQARADYEKAGKTEPWVEPQLATYVLHNKIRPKEAQLHPKVFPEHYYVGLHVPNHWHVYPYDAENIEEHTAIANAQEHFFRERPGELEMAVAACAEVDPALAKYAATALVHYATPQPVPPLPEPPRGLPKRLNSLTRLSAPGADVAALLKEVPPPPELDASEPQAIPADGRTLADGCTRVDTDFAPSREGIYSNLSETYVPKGYVPRIGSLTLVSTMDELADRTQSTSLPPQPSDGAAPPNGATAATATVVTNA